MKINNLQHSNRTGNLTLLEPIKEDGEFFRPTTAQIKSVKDLSKRKKNEFKSLIEELTSEIKDKQDQNLQVKLVEIPKITREMAELYEGSESRDELRSLDR